ncbi:MAG: hypothetical protein ABWY25_09055 [Paenisporosarcina sp.]
MSNQVIVHKGRTNTVTVSMGVNVSGDTITSEIRTEPNQESPLVATWVVTFATNGADGELILKLDDTVTAGIVVDTGYMDLKRVSNGEPIPVFDRPLEVVFRGTVTE